MNAGAITCRCIRDGEDLTAFLVLVPRIADSAGPFFSDDIRAVSVQSRDAQFLSIPQFLHAIDEGDLETSIGTPAVEPPPDRGRCDLRFAGEGIGVDGQLTPLAAGVKFGRGCS